MRRLIDGDARKAKMGVVRDLLAVTKRPTAAKLATLKPGLSDSDAVKRGAQMSGMGGYLPSANDGKAMEHQRLKLGEGKKPKKDEDE